MNSTTFFNFSAVTKRRDDLLEWIKSQHPEVTKEQKHLNANTSERTYWHYGYLMALDDILRLLSPADHIGQYLEMVSKDEKQNN